MKRPFSFLLAPALFVLASGSLSAAPIPKFIPLPPPEPTLQSILDSIYGAGGYSPLAPQQSQFWPGGEVEVSFLASHTLANWNLGFCRVCDGSDLSILTQIVLFGTQALDLGPVHNVVWVNAATLAAPQIVGTVHSANSLNPSGANHLLAFSVAGQPNTYILAFEDWLFNANPASDGDYNDLIVQVRYRQDPDIIPEPSTLLLTGGALLALAAARRRRS